MEKKHSELANYFDHKGRLFAERCTSCGDCLQVCPVFPLTKFADVGPQGIMEKVVKLLEDDEFSEEAYDMVFSCTQGCGSRCAGVCPVKLRPSLAFNSAIVRMTEAGIEPPPLTYQLMPGNRHNFTKVFSALQIKPSEARWVKEVPDNPGHADVVFFGGCGASGLPHLLLDAIDIMESMGLGFVTLAGGDLCCGAAQLLWGNVEASQQASQELVSAVAAFSPEKAVFFCPGCKLILSGIVSHLIPVPFKCYELSEFLFENLDRIHFNRKVSKMVSLHDSCVLSGMPQNYEKLRELLQAIPGLTLVEMEHNREEALCCGGVSHTMRPDIAERMRCGPLKEAEAAGYGEGFGIADYDLGKPS